MQLISGGGYTRLGVGQRLPALAVHGVSVVEVVRVTKRTLHRYRRVYHIQPHQQPYAKDSGHVQRLAHTGKNNYLCHGGYVFARLCLPVCLRVC